MTRPRKEKGKLTVYRNGFSWDVHEGYLSRIDADGKEIIKQYAEMWR